MPVPPAPPAGEKVVVFAHVPPPLHGQSVMVQAGLDALRRRWPERVFHVDARWSESLADVGTPGLQKARKIFGYCRQALHHRFRDGAEVLYYVPGPVKWSAVVRDWLVLGLLRPLFPKTVFHWHAIGQGEWAAGSDRLQLSTRGWLDAAARTLSRLVLGRPALSIAVSPCSDADARAVESLAIRVVNNGIGDPCPDFSRAELDAREAGRRQAGGVFRVLFLSHGTEQKGTLDALDAAGLAAAALPAGVRLVLTLAGGISGELKERVEARSREWQVKEGADRIDFRFVGFVVGADKERLWRQSDILLFPSHWESFGLVVAEAMAWGVPVVAASSDGVRGVMGADHPELVAVGDRAGMAAALVRCFELTGTDRGVGKAWQAREEFVRDFHIERFSEGFPEALSTVMARRPAG